MIRKPKFSSAFLFCIKDVSMSHFKHFFSPLLEILTILALCERTSMILTSFYTVETSDHFCMKQLINRGDTATFT